MIARRRWSTAASWIVLLIIAVVILFPILWGIRTSFVESMEASVIPRRWTLANYAELLREPIFLGYIRNSLVVALGTVAVTLPLALMGGYSLGRFDFPGKNLSVLLLVMPLLPAIAVLVPLIIYMRAVGVYNTLSAVILANVIFQLPFAVWMVRGFLQSVPTEIEEAAAIDGCSRLGALWRITAPLAAPGLIAVALFVLIGSWNNYLFAFAFTASPELRVLPMAILYFIGSWGTNYGGLTAASIIAVLPVMILFLIFQRWFIQGMLAGAVK